MKSAIFSKPRKFRVLLPALVALLATACAVPPVSLMDMRSGQTLATGESATVHFFPAQANLDTGLVLAAGSRYTLDIKLLNYWVDGDIDTTAAGEPIDEYGFGNQQMPFDFLGALRRSNSHNWFELMLYQPRCAGESLRGISELEMNESSGSYSFVADCDGKLALFVNDSHFAYGNNLGYANIALSRLD